MHENDTRKNFLDSTFTTRSHAKKKKEINWINLV